MNTHDLLDYFGSQSNIAKALGIEQPSVFEWFAKGRIPEGRQYQIELATGGKLRASKPALRVAPPEQEGVS